MTMTKSILIITGDGGESYEVLYALHRFQEAGYEARSRHRRSGGSTW